MNPPRLDDYSQFALPRILERFPEWSDRVRFERSSEREPHYAVIELDPVSRSVDSGLYVGTRDAELTVGFHTYHCHFTDHNTSTDPQTLEAGLDFASNLLNEKCGVVTYYQDDRWAGGTWIELPHPAALPHHFAPGCTRVTLRSWRGTFDRDELR